MRVSFGELVNFLNPSPPMSSGFGACAYEFRLIPIEQALSAITCWDKVSSVREWAARTPPTEKIARFTEHLPRPMFVIAFELKALARIWPDEYGGRTEDRLVIWDGNHRLTALAHRTAKGMRDEFLVGAFVGV